MPRRVAFVLALSLGAAACCASASGAGPVRVVTHRDDCPVGACAARRFGGYHERGVDRRGDGQTRARRANTFWQLMVEPAGTSHWVARHASRLCRQRRPRGRGRRVRPSSPDSGRAPTSASRRCRPPSNGGANWAQGVVDRPLALGAGRTGRLAHRRRRRPDRFDGHGGSLEHRRLVRLAHRRHREVARLLERRTILRSDRADARWPLARAEGCLSERRVPRRATSASLRSRAGASAMTSLRWAPVMRWRRRPCSACGAGRAG